MFWRKKVVRAAFMALTLGLIVAVMGFKPTGDKTAAKPFRFVLYGDTRDGHEEHRKLVALILEQKPDLVIQTGDLVHRGSQENLWKIYDDITGEMRRKVPVYSARGNHDAGGTGYEERVTAPFTSGNKLYYSFDKENCHFIALAVEGSTPYNAQSPQYAWLKKDLAAAHGKAQHIFVFFHIAPYSIGSHGPDESVQRILCPLFIKYGVRAVLNGHDHLYYHTIRNGVTYIVSGGGGAPLYPCDEGKGAIPGDKCESVHHIVVCDVDGGELRFKALRENGTEIERFRLTAP
jgi:Icc-related predicted phosphoesterase